MIRYMGTAESYDYEEFAGLLENNIDVVEDDRSYNMDLDRQMEEDKDRRWISKNKQEES